jgi:hypothetical protein
VRAAGAGPYRGDGHAAPGTHRGELPDAPRGRARGALDSGPPGLDTLSTVGVGTVCRRQSGKEGAAIVTRLAAEGLRLHGFGFKITGLRAVGDQLASADSMAWSYAARRQAPLPGCTGHINCANCLRYATKWRARLVETAD